MLTINPVTQRTANARDETMNATTRKPAFDAKKIAARVWSNGVGYTVVDSNRSSRCVAEVILTGPGKSNCRIDRNGNPWKYAAGIPTQNPHSAYEYTLLSGTRCEDWCD